MRWSACKLRTIFSCKTAYKVTHRQNTHFVQEKDDELLATRNIWYVVFGRIFLVRQFSSISQIWNCGMLHNHHSLVWGRCEFIAWRVWLSLFPPIVSLYSYAKQTVSKLQPGKKKIRHIPLLLLIGLLETCWVSVLTLRVKWIVLFAKWDCLLQESTSKANTAAVSWFLSQWVKKVRKRRSDCWRTCVTSLEGWRLRVCVSVCVCRVCRHFLLGSLLYVCPLAWTPVRSFLMISFTVKQRKRERC